MNLEAIAFWEIAMTHFMTEQLLLLHKEEPLKELQWGKILEVCSPWIIGNAFQASFILHS